MSGAGRGGRGGRGGALGLYQANGIVYTEAPLDDEDGVPVFETPSTLERAIAQRQLGVLRRQPDSPYWARQPPPRADEREMPRYTDRYHPDRQKTACAASLLEHAPLQKSVFPPQLFAQFTSTEAKRVRQAPASRRAQIDWDNLHAEEKRTGDGEEEAAPESDEEDLGEYEDEDEDDYAQNYFDNGEDDDDGDHDDGGGDEAAFD